MLDRVALSRLKWHCRRGMLENDLVLTAFFERHESDIDAATAAGLEALLDLADGDLWDLISGRGELGPGAGAVQRSVLERLRACSMRSAH